MSLKTMFRGKYSIIDIQSCMTFHKFFMKMFQAPEVFNLSSIALLTFDSSYYKIKRELTSNARGQA